MSDWAVAWHDATGIDATGYRNVAVFLADRGDHPDDPLSDALADGLPCSLSFAFARVGTVRFRLEAAGDDWLRLVPTAGTDDPESALALLGRCIELFERFDFDLGVVAPESTLADLDATEHPAELTDPADLTLPAATAAVFLDGETTDTLGPATLAATPAVAALELLDGSALLLGGPDLDDARLRFADTRPGLGDSHAPPTTDDLPLRDAMSWALGWLDTPAVAARLAGLLADTATTDDTTALRVAATETLGLLRRTDTGDSLRRALDDPAPAVRATAADALAPTDDERRTALRTAARTDTDPDVRRRAVRSLADGPSTPETVAELATVARTDADASVRAAAVRAVGDDRGPAFHADRLTDDRPVRVAAAETLQLFADGTADADLAAVADRLVPALSDDASPVRRAVADLLGSVPTQSATTALCRAITTDPDAEVRATAVSALGQQFAGQPPAATADARRDDAVDALLAALTDDPAVRERVPDALGRLGDERATGPLIDALSSDRPSVDSADDSADDTAVRRAAANALGNLGDRRAVEPLLAALDDPDDLVREQAAVSLGQLDDERAVGPVVDLLDAADNDRLRYRLVSALSGFSGAQATEALARLAESDDSEDVRTAAEWALTRRE